MLYVVCMLKFLSSIFFILLESFGIFYFSCHSDHFLATCSKRLLMFLSVDVCIPLYILFILFIFIAMLRLRFVPGVYFDVLSAPIDCVCSCCRWLIETSSSDQCCKSYMISAGRGDFVRFFLSKHACFALSQLRLVGELVFAKFERGVFGFLPMCASKGEIFVTPCGVMRKVFIISATSEANLYGVFAGSILITPN